MNNCTSVLHTRIPCHPSDTKHPCRRLKVKILAKIWSARPQLPVPSLALSPRFSPPSCFPLFLLPLPAFLSLAFLPLSLCIDEPLSVSSPTPPFSHNHTLLFLLGTRSPWILTPSTPVWPCRSNRELSLHPLPSPNPTPHNTQHTTHNTRLPCHPCIPFTPIEINVFPNGSSQQPVEPPGHGHQRISHWGASIVTGVLGEQ